MNRGFFILLVLILNMNLVFSSKNIPDECIFVSSSDKNNLNLIDGPKVVLQKYINSQGNEEILMFFYEKDKSQGDIGALRLILNYKKSEDVYSFWSTNLNECKENENGCREYFIKKDIPEICRRSGLEIIRPIPSKEGIEEKLKGINIIDNCANLPKEPSYCSDNIFIRGIGKFYYFLKSIFNPELKSLDLNECKKINIVITGQGFINEQEKGEFTDLAREAIIEGFFKNDVISSNAFRFNFYLLDPSNDFNCATNCLGIDRALCCDNTKIINKVSECPNDFVYVFVNSNKDAGSSTGVISMSTSFNFDPGVVEHELIGHGVGDLRDEYVDEYFRTIGEKPERNCYGDKSCRAWCKSSDDCIIGTGCFEGCELSEWYRPHRTSFMKVSGREIGRYNEILICERIKEFTNKVSGYCNEIGVE